MRKKEIEQKSEDWADLFYTKGSEIVSNITEDIEWCNRRYNFEQGAFWYKEYADKETERLKAELNELKDKLEIQENYNDMLVDELHERDKELNELKANTKNDLIDFLNYIDIDLLYNVSNEEIIKKYYKQKFESNK